MTASNALTSPTGQCRWRGAVVLVGAAVLTATAPVGVQATAVELAPHRAVYELTLERSTAASSISELAGRLVYEVKGSRCKGYGQVTRFVTRSENQKGAVTVMDLRSTFWESGDASAMRFETKLYQDERLTEHTTGEVRRSGPAELKISLQRPRRGRLKFNGEYLFPLQHTASLVQAALDGKAIFIADLYDGAEKGAKTYETTAAIGPRRGPGDTDGLTPLKNASVLAGVPAWPVSLSYYGKKKARADSVPEYELSFLLYANGVSRQLLLDYGSHAIRGVLSRLVMLPSEPCKPGN
ncbi:MAG: cell envelope integrity EipB family protein [Hyphomicrobiaceae bacterium]|nr:cell envelope integrity EipB family protein [Hyphomicrobiaceae bacterium]